MNDEREPEDMTTPEYWATAYLKAGNPGHPEVVRNWFNAAMAHAAPRIAADVWDEAYWQGVSDYEVASAAEVYVSPERANPYRSQA